LKNKNDCNIVLRKNEVLSSKLDVVLKENDFLKNKIISISKEINLISNENKTLKNDLESLVCHANIASPPSVSIACSTLSSSIKNDICMLKKCVDCLGSILSQCAMNHTRLESMFRKKHAPPVHAHKPQHTHASHIHTHNTMYAHVHTCTHYGCNGHLTKFCYDRLNDLNFTNRFVWVKKGANPYGPNKVWVTKFTPILFDIDVDSHLM